jgi:DNA-binding transcriptional LysR family regulator
VSKNAAAAGLALGYTQSAISRQIASHALAGGEYLYVADLRRQRWIAGQGDELVMGVWPGLDERPEIGHTARDWLAKLHLVAAGCGITTVPAALVSAVPPGVRVLPVRGGPAEQRRILLARVPRPLPEPVAHVAARPACRRDRDRCPE